MSVYTCIYCSLAARHEQESLWVIFFVWGPTKSIKLIDLGAIGLLS